MTIEVKIEVAAILDQAGGEMSTDNGGEQRRDLTPFANHEVFVGWSFCGPPLTLPLCGFGKGGAPL